MPSSTSTELQPLTEAEQIRCLEDGADFSRLHVWQGSELHLVHPLSASTAMVDRISLAFGAVGLASLAYVWLHPNLETLAIGVPGGIFLLVMGWLMFAESRSSWTLRMQSGGFVLARSGRWFPHGDRIRRGSLDEVSATWRTAHKGPGCRLWTRLGGHKLDLLSQTLPHAEQLEAIWALHRGGAGDKGSPLDPVS